MIRSMAKGVGQFALLIVAMAILTAAGLFVTGGFLLTWPILRLSPRDRRIRAGMDFAQSGMTLLTVFTDGSVKRALAESLTEDEPEDDGLSVRIAQVDDAGCIRLEGDDFWYQRVDPSVFQG